MLPMTPTVTFKRLLVEAIDAAEEWARRHSVAPDLKASRELASQL